MAVIKWRERPILAIDASSTATGLAMWYGGKLVATHVIKVKGDYRRLVTMGLEFQHFLSANPVADGVEVWIEEPFYSPGKSNDLPIKMAHGILMFECAIMARASRFSWNFVSVSTWRKKFISKRVDSAAAKKIVMGQVSQQFGLEVTDDNIGDALGILSWRLSGGK
jgi:hypothetical protein